jgi:hypothetical protein
MAGILGIWLFALACPAQVAEPAGIWPPLGQELWSWVSPRTDLAPTEVDAVLGRVAAEQTAFVDPGFSATVFFARKIRLSAGKSRKRKGYGDRPEKADDLRIEAEWQNGYLNQYRGQSYVFIALDAVRGLALHYLSRPRDRFPKAPEGRNWIVNILAERLFSFFFYNEDSARAFINAAASAIARRGLELKLGRSGLTWENITPAQAVDMGPALAGPDGRPANEGVLITMVAAGGPADRAGVRPLDAILGFNGEKVKNFSHFSLLLDALAPGAKASLLLLRRLKDPLAFPGSSAWDTLTVTLESE